MRPGLVGLLLLVAAVACSGSSTRDPSAAGSTGSPTSTSPASVTPAASPTHALTAPKGWRTYGFKGISFAYPPLKGLVTEVSDGKTGPRHAWSVKRSDLCDPRGICRSYEIAAVNDGCPGSGRWPTYAHRWVSAGGQDFLTICAGDGTVPIEPLRTAERPDGLGGVIYDANAWFTGKGDTKIPGARAAVLNFPSGFDKRFEAIAFYFDEATSLDVIETVLRLVRLES